MIQQFICLFSIVDHVNGVCQKKDIGYDKYVNIHNNQTMPGGEGVRGVILRVTKPLLFLNARTF